jgi:hypothetical protein
VDSRTLSQAADGTKLGTPATASCVYRGAWGIDGRIAYIDDGGTLRPILDGGDAVHVIEWGAPSVGCERLARAILQHATGDHRVAQAWGEGFAEVLSRFPHQGFALTHAEVLRWVEVQPGQTTLA